MLLSQGAFLTLNSEPETMQRNSGLFWAMMQSSMLVGNTFVYFQFHGLDDVGAETRTTIVAVFTVICAVGIGVFCTLR